MSESIGLPLQVRIKPEDRLVLVNYSLGRHEGHIKAHTEGYENHRKPLVDGITWENLDKASYHPEDYTAYDQDNPPSWADPKNPHQSKNAPGFLSYEGKINVDNRGRPLNPMGPTGLEGRGMLGNWGANNSADPIATRLNDKGQLEMIVVKRKDIGEWAIPGGMVDRGERVTVALQRELGEETSARLDFTHATPVYQGYVDDPRNTDNAWIETDAYHLHLPNGINVPLDVTHDPDSGAADARWMVLNETSIASLYASHPDLVRKAIIKWQEQSGAIVDKNGMVGIAA